MSKIVYEASIYKEYRAGIYVVVISLLTMLIFGNYEMLGLFAVMIPLMVIVILKFRKREISIDNGCIIDGQNRIDLMEFKSIIVTKPWFGYTHIHGYYRDSENSKGVILINDIYKKGIEEIYTELLEMLSHNDIQFRNDELYGKEQQMELMKKRVNGDFIALVTFSFISIAVTILLFLLNEFMAGLMFLGFAVGTLIMLFLIIQLQRAKDIDSFNTNQFITKFRYTEIFIGVYFLLYIIAYNFL